MKAEDIKPGVEIIVPRGADGIRKLPYRLRVDKILHSSVPDRVQVSGTLHRLSGAWSAKKGNAALRVATIDPAKVRLATEEDGR
jgi:hypothetical protein